MFVNRSGKSLLSQSWVIAMLGALPVWVALYLITHPTIDLSWPVRSPGLFLLLIMLYPVLEEMVFRGFIQGELMRKAVFRQAYMGITLANILTSSLFVAAHLFSHSVTMAALVFLPSMIFGYFRDRFDGWLLPAILLHGYYNLGYFLIFNPR